MFSTQSISVNISPLIPILGTHTQRIFPFACFLIHDAMADWSPELGSYDDVLAGPGEFGDCLAEDLFRDPVGIAVCCVEKVDAQFVAFFQDGEGFGFFDTPGETAAPVAEGHAWDC